MDIFQVAQGNRRRPWTSLCRGCGGLERLSVPARGPRDVFGGLWKCPSYSRTILTLASGPEARESSLGSGT